jgi:acyl carrier protein
MNNVSVASIEERLIEEVAIILGVDAAAVDPERPLPKLGMDSMGFVELLVVIEKAFNLRLIESGLTREDFETIRALAGRISKGLPG